MKGKKIFFLACLNLKSDGFWGLGIPLGEEKGGP
jgi:hypothetical protein